MEEVTEKEKMKTETVRLTVSALDRIEVVLGILSFAGFGLLLILLYDVLTHPALIIEYAPADPRAGVWIQGVQFSQLIASLTLMSLFGLFRTARTIIQTIRKALI